MFYLVLAIICSSAIALIFKYSESSNTNRYVITSANYFIAFTMSLFMVFSKGMLSGITHEIPFAEEFKLISNHNAYILSPYSSIIWGLIVGGISGSFFFLSFIYYQ
ncbi:MAG: hypothetical protein GX833_10795, partial [Clostridium sp.]|nr:hypothetical protein [Clostridium sp.]